MTPAKWPKSANKMIQSFSKFACHHFIAIWGIPQNLKKIEEVRHFHLTFSVEWPQCNYDQYDYDQYNMTQMTMTIFTMVARTNDILGTASSMWVRLWCMMLARTTWSMPTSWQMESSVIWPGNHWFFIYYMGLHFTCDLMKVSRECYFSWTVLILQKLKEILINPHWDAAKKVMGFLLPSH